MGIVALRSITRDDIDVLLELTGNPDVVKYIPGMIQDRDTASAWIAGLGPDEYEMIVLLDGQIIGECSLAVQEESGEIGLMLFPEYWRQGYGSQVVRQLTEMAKGLGLEQVIAQTAEENGACVRLLQKQGFSKVGMGWMINEDDFEKPLKEQFTMGIFRRNIKEEDSRE